MIDTSYTAITLSIANLTTNTQQQLQQTNRSTKDYSNCVIRSRSLEAMYKTEKRFGDRWTPSSRYVKQTPPLMISSFFRDESTKVGRITPTPRAINADLRSDRLPAHQPEKLFLFLSDETNLFPPTQRNTTCTRTTLPRCIERVIERFRFHQLETSG